MLDYFTIFTKGGLVLYDRSFSSQFTPSSTSSSAANTTNNGLFSSLLSSSSSAHPVDILIKDALLEDRNNNVNNVQSFFHVDNFALKWRIDHLSGLVFVAVYPKVLHLGYIDHLLEKVKSTFTTQFSTQLQLASTTDSSGEWYQHYHRDFDPVFEKIFKKIEQDPLLNPTTAIVSESSSSLSSSSADSVSLPFEKDTKKAPRKFHETKKFQNTMDGQKKASNKDNNSNNNNNTDDSDTSGMEMSQKEKLALLKKKGVGMKNGSKKNGKPGKSSPSSEDSKKGNTNKKKLRVWGAPGNTAGDAGALDYSNANAEDDGDNMDEEKLDSLIDKRGLGKLTKDGLYDAAELTANHGAGQYGDDDDEEDDEDDDEESTGGTKNKTLASSIANSASSKLSSWLSAIPLTSRILTAEDLSPVMVKLRDQLINKNVAAEIATDVIASIEKELIGTTLKSFTSISSVVLSQLEQSLQRILTPRTSTDLLRDILESKRKKQVFSIVFVGVNGVGKSTNLSKVCFWLLQNKLRVLIAACDTFRSGAVEQLRVHVRNLKKLTEQLSGSVLEEDQIALFEKGYGKDSATIAKEAITHASKNGYDVILVDTAGRMQDNEPLMRALAKLVTLNNPDRILFVGEALVGNEAVDQLTKFNAALKDFSGVAQPRQIDGIVLTKFDTIDDKVGAALSMTYTTGQPILFVGTGQTYTDLRKMNVQSVVEALLR